MKKDIYDSIIPKSLQRTLKLQQELTKSLKIIEDLNRWQKSLGLNTSVLQQLREFDSINKTILINNKLTGWHETLKIGSAIRDELAKIDDLSGYKDLKQKIPPWHEALEIQKKFIPHNYIEDALRGININWQIFKDIIPTSENQRIQEIISALREDSIFFGEFESLDDLMDEEDENGTKTQIILAEDLKERLETVNFLPIKIFERISNDPKLMHGMNPRDFEFFIAELLSKLGFENIIVTPRSGDKGRDIIATQSPGDIPMIVAFECKKYAPNRKIGPDTMRALLGTISHHPTRANKGVLITTSSFTAASQKFIASESMLAGKDFNDLVTWINQIKKK